MTWQSMIWLDEWFTVSVCAAQLDREGNLIVPMRGCCELNWSWWTVVIELISRVMWTTSSFRLLPFRVNCSSDDGFGGDNNKVPSSPLFSSATIYLFSFIANTIHSFLFLFLFQTTNNKGSSLSQQQQQNQRRSSRSTSSSRKSTSRKSILSNSFHRTHLLSLHYQSLFLSSRASSSSAFNFTTWHWLWGTPQGC
jgi:hypothetical protein